MNLVCWSRQIERSVSICWGGRPWNSAKCQTLWLGLRPDGLQSRLWDGQGFYKKTSSQTTRVSDRIFTLSTSGAVLYCSGMVYIGTEHRASIPVPERCRPTCPHHKLSRPNCTGMFRNKTHKILGLGTERYGMRDTFTDVDRWSGTIPAPYPSKNASMDRVIVSSSPMKVVNSNCHSVKCTLYYVLSLLWYDICMKKCIFFSLNLISKFALLCYHETMYIIIFSSTVI